MFEEDKDGSDGGLLAVVSEAGILNRAGERGARRVCCVIVVILPGTGTGPTADPTAFRPRPGHPTHGRGRPIRRCHRCRVQIRVSDRHRGCPVPKRRAMEGSVRKVRRHHPHHTPSCSLISSRLGQEPPPQPTEDAFDGRSLAEVSPSPVTAVPACADSDGRRNWLRTG